MIIQVFLKKRVQKHRKRNEGSGDKIYTPGVESPLLSLSERGVRKKGQAPFSNSNVEKVKK